MFNTIIEATQHLCKNQLELECNASEAQKNQTAMFIGYLDIEDDKTNYRVYIALNQPLTQHVASVFLFEDESDEETLQDMFLEVINLIVGSAKVIAQDRLNHTVTISTPHFIKKDIFDLEIHQMQKISKDNFEMILALREENE